MKRRTWQNAEARVAGLFGARRSALSGGAAVGTMSDSMHPRLYISVKTSAKPAAAIRLWFEAAEQAKRERKVALVALCQAGEPRGDVWLVVRAGDLEAVAREYVGRVPENPGGVVGE